MTDIECNDCGHVRETTEDYPTLVCCNQCGSGDVEYVDETGRLHDPLTFEEYQERSKETAQGYANVENLPTSQAEKMSALFLATAVNGEAGELGEKVKKAVRENEGSYLNDAEAEIGDVLWYLAQLAELLDTTLGEIAEENLSKLSDRQERDVITGEGDSR